MQLSRADEARPLYRQIADRLRYEIVTGRRPADARLPSLRGAADEWGINLHTVRKAYKLLEESGYATIGPRGARVAPLEPRVPDSGESLEDAVTEFAERMRQANGASPGQLAELLRRLEGEAETRPSEQVTVVECSRTLSGEIADAVSRRLGVRVEAVDLHEDRLLPDGPVIGTHFHTEHLRQRLHDRPGDLHLIRIRPAESLLSALAAEAHTGFIQRVILMDRLPGSAADLAADMEARMEGGPGGEAVVETRILRNPLLGFPDMTAGTRVIATPQTWDRLTPELREREDVLRLAYEIEPADLDRLPEMMGIGPET